MKLKVLAIAIATVGLPVIAGAQMPATATSSTTTTSTKDTTEVKPMVVVHHHRHHNHHHRMTHKSSVTKTDSAGTETTTKTDMTSKPK